MPILIIIILAIMVGQIGFWDTFQSVLGAVGVIILFFALLAALAAAAVAYFYNRVRRRF
ncbi:hypothetical protein [Terrihabitans rhizophilus]|jgi:hypothetical protein|uniref:Uncharacterized protein n=1 Tax=Terrihabitans rhizophilus TaxID=3092662 RepID=A0ABU4RQN8_9HYPH|nr:hypothetical protein [Terrihabitans sp. PJ23]MDX6805081.1 hypothetical protein [Terrihabitans sp. PJ23]